MPTASQGSRLVPQASTSTLPSITAASPQQAEDEQRFAATLRVENSHITQVKPRQARTVLHYSSGVSSVTASDTTPTRRFCRCNTRLLPCTRLQKGRSLAGTSHCQRRSHLIKYAEAAASTLAAALSYNLSPSLLNVSDRMVPDHLSTVEEPSAPCAARQRSENDSICKPASTLFAPVATPNPPPVCSGPHTVEIVAAERWSMKVPDLDTWRQIEPSYEEMLPALTRARYIYRTASIRGQAAGRYSRPIDLNVALSDAEQREVSESGTLKHILTLLAHLARRLKLCNQRAVSDDALLAAARVDTALKHTYLSLAVPEYTPVFPSPQQCLPAMRVPPERWIPLKNTTKCVVQAIDSLLRLSGKPLTTTHENQLHITNPRKPQPARTASVATGAPRTDEIPTSSSSFGRGHLRAQRPTARQRASLLRATTRALVLTAHARKQQLAALTSSAMTPEVLSEIASCITRWCDASPSTRPPADTLCSQLVSLTEQAGIPAPQPESNAASRCGCFTGLPVRLAMFDHLSRRGTAGTPLRFGATFSETRDPDAVLYATYIMGPAFVLAKRVRATALELQRRGPLTEDVKETLHQIKHAGSELITHNLWPSYSRKIDLHPNVARDPFDSAAFGLSTMENDALSSKLQMYLTELHKIRRMLCSHLSTFNSYSQIFDSADIISTQNLRALTSHYIELANTARSAGEAICEAVPSDSFVWPEATSGPAHLSAIPNASTCNASVSTHDLSSDVGISHSTSQQTANNHASRTLETPSETQLGAPTIATVATLTAASQTSASCLASTTTHHQAPSSSEVAPNVGSATASKSTETCLPKPRRRRFSPSNFLKKQASRMAAAKSALKSPLHKSQRSARHHVTVRGSKGSSLRSLQNRSTQPPCRVSSVVHQATHRDDNTTIRDAANTCTVHPAKERWCAALDFKSKKKTFSPSPRLPGPS